MSRTQKKLRRKERKEKELIVKKVELVLEINTRPPHLLHFDMIWVNVARCLHYTFQGFEEIKIKIQKIKN